MTSNRALSTSEHERTARRSQPATVTPAGQPAAVHPLLALQRQLGNAQVTQLVQASRDLGRQSEEEEELQASHDVGRQEEEELQMKAEAAPRIGLEGGPVGPDMQRQIQAKRGRGAALSEGTRAHMEAAFGADFGDVRVHHDAESDALSRQMTAKAFTTGSDIFLRKDVNPGDSTLLAHELTHVIQQRAMASGGGGMSVRPAGDQYEQEADAVAKQVTALGRAPGFEEAAQL